jgi:hypothetical protein
MVDDTPTPALISRQEAIARGLKRYRTGKPCKHGHVAERQLANNRCIVCQNIAKRDQYVPGSVDRQKARVNEARYRAAHPDKLVTKNARRYTIDRPKTLARDARWRARNPIKVRQRRARWQKANPEKMCALAAQRRAAQANPSWVDRQALAAIFAARPPGMHVDHIVPLGGSKRPARTAEGYPISGLHVPWNLRYLPKAANQAKWYRMRPEDQALCEYHTPLLFSPSLSGRGAPGSCPPPKGEATEVGLP